MGGESDLGVVEENSRMEMRESRQPSGVLCWRGRTRGERYLMMALTTVVFVAVLLAFSLASLVVKAPLARSDDSGVMPEAQALLAPRTPRVSTDVSSDSSAASSDSSAVRSDPSAGVCLTKGCVKAAAAVIERLNETQDPCEDFFEFACGNFIKNTIIPDEKSSVTMFSKVRDDLNEKMRILMEEGVKPTDSQSTLMAKNLYASCMDIDTIQELGLSPLHSILQEMGGWPVIEGPSWNESSFSWIELNYINRRIGFSVDYLFDFSVTTDVRNSTWRIIWLDQPGLGMSREYLMRGLGDKDVQAYLKYSTDVAILLGADPALAKKEMKEVLEFEMKVANISLPREERRNLTKLYNIMTLAEAEEITPDIPWVEYINRLLPDPLEVDGTEKVGISDPNFFRNLTKILNNTPKRVIANYMLWRASSSAAAYLSEDIRDIQFEYSKALTGKTTRPPRWKECMGTVSGKLSYAIGNLYVKNFFNEDAKAIAEELVKFVRQDFDRVLNEIDWMDEATRQEAKLKADTIRSHIAYPAELLMDEKLMEHYGDLKITNGSLMGNMKEIAVFGTDYSFSRLREIVDKLDWKRQAAVAVVNAYYSSIENSIKFPAGILQGVFFEPDRPKYMNFGAIGFVIGHEITHGFDDQGKQFDSEGNLKNWWAEDTERRFLDRAKCIIYQYGNYTAPENNMKLNGINTQGENIADNGGIKEAYNAYQKFVETNGSELSLPGLDYTPNQLFWVSAAQIWCSKYRPEALKIRILTGVHSPGRFRIVGSFSNSQEFAKDWNCPVGSYMNPKNKCSVW